MRIQVDKQDELVYLELVVHAAKMVSKYHASLGTADVAEVAHDVTASFIVSDSYNKTYSSAQGDLIFFFSSYVYRSVKKYLTFHQREYGRMLDFVREGDKGAKHSQDGVAWFVHSIEDFSDRLGCRESKVEIRSLIEQVRRMLGVKEWLGVKLSDVFNVMIESTLYHGRVKVGWCAEMLGVGNHKASRLIKRVKTVAERCYAG